MLKPQLQLVVLFVFCHSQGAGMKPFQPPWKNEFKGDIYISSLFQTVCLFFIRVKIIEG